MAHDVTLITGDGTGPELAAAARKCVDATGVKINWDVQEAGRRRHGPDRHAAARRRDGKRPPHHVCAEGARSPRRSAPAFAASTSICGRRSGCTPASAPASSTRACAASSTSVPIDLVIVRENTEDLYAGIEFERGKPETAELIKFINEKSTGSKIKTGPRRPASRSSRSAFPAPSGSCATPSTMPARTAARRSPASTRRTS